MTTSFIAGTGLMGATEPGQKVTPGNISELPPGSVVRLGDGSRLIHLHDELWLWCGDQAWCYDTLPGHLWRLDDQSVLCHLPCTKPVHDYTDVFTPAAGVAAPPVAGDH